MQALQDCSYATCFTPSTNLGNANNILISGNILILILMHFSNILPLFFLKLMYLYKSHNFINSFESLT